MDERAIFFQKYSQWYTGNKIDFSAVKNQVIEGIKSYSYEDLRWHLNYICHSAFRLTCVCLGFIQFFAIWGALANIFPSHNIITPLISLILAFIPLVGTVLGAIAAYANWDWNLFGSLCFFILPYFIANSPLNMIAVYETCKDMQRWKIEGKSF